MEAPRHQSSATSAPEAHLSSRAASSRRLEPTIVTPATVPGSGTAANPAPGADDPEPDLIPSGLRAEMQIFSVNAVRGLRPWVLDQDTLQAARRQRFDIRDSKDGSSARLKTFSASGLRDAEPSDQTDDDPAPELVD